MAAPKEENIHAEHRKRLRARCIEHGLDSFEPHQILELILTYAIPRADVNPLAHRILKRFGSLSAVFVASVGELASVDGLGESSALLLTLFGSAYRRALIEDSKRTRSISDLASVKALLYPYFVGVRTELVYIVALSPTMKVLRCVKLSDGTSGAASISVSKVTETAIASGAMGVIIAHNHPNGEAKPSREDIETTLLLIKTLNAIDVTLVDHVVFAGEDCASIIDACKDISSRGKL